VGPNQGAINRAALIASDHVCVPLAPDLYSLQGLKNLGPALMRWRGTWADLTTKAPKDLSLPAGSMSPAGYVVMQHGMPDSRPVKAYQRWMDKIPPVYRTAVLGKPTAGAVPKVENDPNCLAQLKHYRSLMPLAMEAHKPMFHLKPADGAIGAHGEAVKDCRDDFLRLARKVGASAGLKLP
jgi:cellulose biosynthesis protein BcsQ